MLVTTGTWFGPDRRRKRRPGLGSGYTERLRTQVATELLGNVPARFTCAGLFRYGSEMHREACSADRGEGHSDSEGGGERSLCEGPRAPGGATRMGLARGESALASRNNDGRLSVRRRRAPAGLLLDDDDGVEHRLTAVIGAGQGRRWAPLLVMALCGACCGRSAPCFAQHAGIRPSEQCHDDR
jgi:hypothetical protein